MGTERNVFEPKAVGTVRFLRTRNGLTLLALTSSLLFQQRFFLSLELGVDRRSPFRANFPVQPVRAAKRISKTSARLSMKMSARFGIEG